jgi:hypothetical protein
VFSSKKLTNTGKKLLHRYTKTHPQRQKKTNDAKETTRRVTMQSTQIIDSTAFTGSRLSTHRSSGKTASISNNRKMCFRPAANLAAAEPFLAHRKNIRHEETTSSNKVASRFQLKREQELCIEQNGRKRVSF